LLQQLFGNSEYNITGAIADPNTTSEQIREMIFNSDLFNNAISDAERLNRTQVQITPEMADFLKLAGVDVDSIIQNGQIDVNILKDLIRTTTGAPATTTDGTTTPGAGDGTTSASTTPGATTTDGTTTGTGDGTTSASTTPGATGTGDGTTSASTDGTGGTTGTTPPPPPTNGDVVNAGASTTSTSSTPGAATPATLSANVANAVLNVHSVILNAANVVSAANSTPGQSTTSST
jgi:hypothetical protein